MAQGATVRLQDFCDIVQGGRLRLSGNDFVADGYPAFGAGGLNGNVSVPEFDRPAVILSAIGARCGKCFYTEGKWTSLANTQVILPDLDRADCKYLWFQLNEEGRWHRSGTAQPFIKPSDVKSHCVFLPPLPEQRRIADLLSRAEGLRAKRRAALAQLDTLTQSIFLEMFGDPAANPKGWPLRRLGEMAGAWSGAGFPLDYQGEGEGDYPFFKVGDMNTPGNESVMSVARHMITEDVRKALRAKAFPQGTVIFPKIGAAIATNKKRALARPSCVDNNVLAIVPGASIQSAFLFGLLSFKNLSDFAQRGNPPSIRKSDVEDWEVPIPPFAMQSEYVRRLAGVEGLMASHRASLAELYSLFFSLQQRAFRGEL